MAYLKAAEVRKMNHDDRDGRLKELRQELLHERGIASMGGSPPSPGKIRQIRRQISRILTIENEERLGIRGAKPAPGAPKPATPKPSAKPTPKAAPRPAKAPAPKAKVAGAKSKPASHAKKPAKPAGPKTTKKEEPRRNG